MPSRSASGERRRAPALRSPAPSQRRSSGDRPAQTKDRVAVGKILRPHGVRGELKVEIWSDVDGRFARGEQLFLNLAGNSRKVVIEQCRSDKGHLLLRLSGIDGREAADAVRGGILEVGSDQVPEAPEGFYYHFQLEGCECHDETAGLLGSVVEVVEDGGGFLLRVERQGKSVLVPFVDAFLRRVDVAEKRIDLHLPEGLVSVCTSKS